MRFTKALLILALLFTMGTSAFAVELPDAPKPQSTFTQAFLAESAAYTTANVLDAYTTVRDSNWGYTEAGFPKGSAAILGHRPGIVRYGLVMGGLQVATELVSYRLERSDKKALRMLGHGLMLQGSYMHFSGAIQNFTMISGPVVAPTAPVLPTVQPVHINR